VVPVFIVGRFDHLWEATARDAAAAGCVCGCLLWCRQLARVNRSPGLLTLYSCSQVSSILHCHSSSFLLLFVCVAAVAEGGYVLPPTAGQPAIRGVGNTYAPPGNRLQTCLPCQSGLAVPPTYYGLQSDRTEVCQVPPGRFWELNVVRECPQVSIRFKV
jgi:hypothetical protein